MNGGKGTVVAIASKVNNVQYCVECMMKISNDHAKVLMRMEQCNDEFRDSLSHAERLLIADPPDPQTIFSFVLPPIY